MLLTISPCQGHSYSALYSGLPWSTAEKNYPQEHMRQLHNYSFKSMLQTTIERSLSNFSKAPSNRIFTVPSLKAANPYIYEAGTS